MRRAKEVLAVLGLALALAGSAAGAMAAGTVLIEDPALKGSASLSVSIPGVTPGGPLPTNYAFEGRNLSPPVAWSPGPPGVRSYAVVLQDPDWPRPEPVVHWIAYSIPAGLHALPRGVKNMDEPARPPGVLQGPNTHGGVGYSGPHPPAGDPPHHYHLQVFALDARTPRLRPGADLPTLERAMAGHVLAAGELVATYPGPPSSGAKPAAGG